MHRALLPLLVLSLGLAASLRAQDTPQASEDEQLIRKADLSRVIWIGQSGIRIDEFVDYSCSTCRSFHVARADSLKGFVTLENHTLAIRMFPIPRLMRGYHGAEAAFCAGGLKGRTAFIDMHDLLFENQESWAKMLDPTPVLESYAESLGVPMAEFRDCMARDAMAPLIISDIRIAQEAGVGGTPTFVFNRSGQFTGDVAFYGNQPLSMFNDAVKAARNQ